MRNIHKLFVKATKSFIKSLYFHFQLKSPTDESTGTDGGEAPAANGSIFTMTLKNNHLIVETEERNVSNYTYKELADPVDVVRPRKAAPATGSYSIL